MARKLAPVMAALSPEVDFPDVDFADFVDFVGEEAWHHSALG